MILQLTVWLAFMVWFPQSLAVETVAEFPYSHRDGEISIELLERKLERTRGKSDIDRETRLERIRLYERAIDNLEAYQLFQKRYARLDRMMVGAANEREQLGEQLQALKDPMASPEPVNDATAGSFEELARTLRRTNAEEMIALQNLVSLRKQLTVQRQRLIEARQELTATVNRMSQQPARGRSGNTRSTSPLLAEARRLEHRSAQLAERARERLLSLELASHNPRLKLLRQRIELEQLKTAQLQRRGRNLERILSERRLDQARSIESETQALKQRFATQHPLLRGASQDNAAIGKRLLPLAEAIDASTESSRRLQQQIDELQKNYTTTLQKIESSGTSTAAMSRVIEAQRRALPNAGEIDDELAAKQQLAADLMLEMYSLEEQIEALRDIQAFSRQLTDQADRQAAQGTSETDSGELDALASLLRQRHAIYRMLLSWREFYLIQVQQNIHFLGLSSKTLADFENYLKERQLWTRSIVDSRSTLPAYPSAEEIATDWAAERDLLLGIASHGPWRIGLLIALGVAFGVLALRGVLIRQIASTARYIGDAERDRFRDTAKALFITLLLVIPGPLIIAGTAAQLMMSPEQNRLTIALQSGLWTLAENWFFLLFFYQICRPDGLAQRHFGWDEAMLKSVRTATLWLMLLMVPIAWINQTLVSYYAVDADNLLRRVTLALSLLVFTGSFLYVLRKGSPVNQTLQSRGQLVALVRLRWMRWIVFIALPLVLLLITCFGYVNSAVIIGVQVKQSIWVMLVVMVFYELCKRWLLLSQARHSNDRSDNMDPPGAMTPRPATATTYRGRLAAFGSLGEESLRLVSALTIILAAVGLLAVWSDTLPALGYLNGIELWRYNSVVEDRMIVSTVTLADLSQSILALALVFFLYRHMPPILDLILQQVFGLTPGNRHTIITLCTYGVVCIGVGFALVKLGFEWSRFQWLVAALGVGIGFGLREIIANFVSGMIIMLERPIRVGDLVTIGTIEGTVSRIRIRATNITTYDQQELVVPNKDFITASLLNWSLSGPVIRLSTLTSASPTALNLSGPSN